jgi:transposase
MNRPPYPTGVSNLASEYLVPRLPTPKAGGRVRIQPVREMVKAIFDVRRRACAWRRLPQDLPAWKMVYHNDRLWHLQSLWDRLYQALHTAVRVQAGRKSEPSAALAA